MPRVGQNRIYALYMTIYLVLSLPKTPYTHRIFRVRDNPTHAFPTPALWPWLISALVQGVFFFRLLLKERESLPHRGILYTCIVAVAELRREADCCVGSASLRELRLGAVVGARIVPRQTDDDGITCGGIGGVYKLSLKWRVVMCILNRLKRYSYRSPPRPPRSNPLHA